MEAEAVRTGGARASEGRTGGDDVIVPGGKRAALGGVSRLQRGDACHDHTMQIHGRGVGQGRAPCHRSLQRAARLLAGLSPQQRSREPRCARGLVAHGLGGHHLLLLEGLAGRLTWAHLYVAQRPGLPVGDEAVAAGHTGAHVRGLRRRRVVGARSQPGALCLSLELVGEGALEHDRKGFMGGLWSADTAPAL